MNIIKTIILLMVTSVAIAWASPLMTFEFNNIENLEGRIYLILVENEEAFKQSDPPEEQVVFKAGVRVDQKNIKIDVSGIKPGRYAAMVFHDLNGNEALDVNSLKIPKEPYGFSNNKKGLFGPPKWKDASFVLEDKDIILDIKFF